MKKKAGHRRWAARGGKVAGRHMGDIMPPATRSKLMSRIQGKNTSPERIIAELLNGAKIFTERHSPDLHGKPDFVFREQRLAVFVDGDFWHGYRFPLWSHKLSPRWREKIAKNRARDKRNFAALRRRGWNVLRVWEHQIEQSAQRCLERIVARLELLSTLD